MYAAVIRDTPILRDTPFLCDTLPVDSWHTC